MPEKNKRQTTVYYDEKTDKALTVLTEKTGLRTNQIVNAAIMDYFYNVIAQEEERDKRFNATVRKAINPDLLKGDL